VESRLEGRWPYSWLLGWRDVTDARASARTVVASAIPRVAVGDKYLLMMPSQRFTSLSACLLANLCSYSLDYVTRQKIGGISLKYYIMKQLPVLPPATYEQQCPWHRAQQMGEWVTGRALELAYTSNDMKAFASDCGYDGPPFGWNPDRRFHLRCELDAAFFHLYGIQRDDVDCIMDTFPIVRKQEERRYGEYKSKRVILEMYDSMATGLSQEQ
ncbi:MAG: restriction endonuclease, partial [Armatimonadetes bacterium]|nr:restriction endonuclease [Armatimonadota bacterium]